ncbi:hypothetical protein NP233_g498 [Leucocoprinus birnbaumii]|uniref:RING-type E3 ubiquitin transferase n=1 Tax=Leucocoprinus birnbaumii TaxID=56174 RepID=A0AAD5W216_9AGAR|nr:hypothetical protein NP233_g498 [Leucocoprinus birnbaumii]
MHQGMPTRCSCHGAVIIIMTSPTASPPSKKARLEEDEENLDVRSAEDEDLDNPDTNCSICLQAMEDRTVIPTCSHEFCFDCLMIWTAQSRRCPLCTQTIGEYVIHDIRTRYDYRKHHLAPLRSSSPQLLRPPQTTAAIEARNAARRRRQERERERHRREELDERDQLELSIAMRRWIYKHDLYAKHVASNSFTKYRPYPTPAQFTASPDLISRTTTFLRRELQVWHGLDVEFLTNLIISLMKAIDIRSESAVKLLAEFLDMDSHYESGNRHINAEHFAHEVYSYVRSPYRDLFVYDSVVQYERPPNVSPPPQTRRQRTRWNAWQQGRDRSPERRFSRSPPRSSRATEDYRDPSDHLEPRRPECSASRNLTSDDAIPRSCDEAVSVPERVAPQTPKQLLSQSSSSVTNQHVSSSGLLAQTIGGHRGSQDLKDTRLTMCSEFGLPKDSPGADMDKLDFSVSAEPTTTGNERGMTVVTDTTESQHPVLSLRSTLDKEHHLSSRGRVPRQLSLSESVRAHLSLAVSSDRPRTSGYDGLKHHMPPNENSVDETEEGMPTQWCATDPHQGITDNHGETARRPHLVRHLISNTSHTENETTAQVREIRTSPSLRRSVISTRSITPRPSSFYHGHQDDFRQINFASQTLATPLGSSTSPRSDPSNFSAPSIVFGDSATASTSKPPSSAQIHTVSRMLTKNDRTEAHQVHVGSTPPAISTHGPRIPAPATIHQDQNPTRLRSDLRAKLLSRLREEKKQVDEDSKSMNMNVKEVPGQQSGSSVNVDDFVPTSEFDRNSPNHNVGADGSSRRSIRDFHDHTDGDGQDPTPSISNVDSALREARLRTRVRLRTKLEGEKRFSGNQ